jgi:hypothetical protein
MVGKYVYVCGWRFEQLIATQLVGIASVGILWNQKMIIDTTLREISPLCNL